MRPPAILQVLPSLVSGGVERGTVEIAEAIAGAGWRPIVASAGGPLVTELERVGARHVTLPLATKNPAGIGRNAGSLAALIRAEGVAGRPCAVPRPGLVGAGRRAARGRALRDHLPRSLQ
jgi:hypothetical protein